VLCDDETHANTRPSTSLTCRTRGRAESQNSNRKRAVKHSTPRSKRGRACSILQSRSLASITGNKLGYVPVLRAWALRATGSAKRKGLGEHGWSAFGSHIKFEHRGSSRRGDGGHWKRVAAASMGQKPVDVTKFAVRRGHDRDGQRYSLAATATFMERDMQAILRVCGSLRVWRERVCKYGEERVR
jgi:hypothetical protein